MCANRSAFCVLRTLSFSLFSAWPEEPFATLAYDKPEDATEQDEGRSLAAGVLSLGRGGWLLGGGPLGQLPTI